MGRVIIALITAALAAMMAGCVSSPAQCRLTITSTEGGRVTEPGEGTFTYDQGRVLNLVAQAEEGYRFVNWSGDVDTIADVQDATTTITMAADYSITANFEKVALHRLTISSTKGGSVTTPGEGVFTYPKGTVVNLVATPDPACRFLNWTGDVRDIADANNAATTVTVNGDYAITANFAQGALVKFADPNLEAAVREAIGIPDRAIYASDLEPLTSLSASGKNITDLGGLDHCINLTQLDLSYNRISDIGPVANLTRLVTLWLDLNHVGNISALLHNQGLGQGDSVYLRGNPLSWSSIHSYIPQLKLKGVSVIYDEQGIAGNVTVVPNCERTVAEYTITFDIRASLTSGVHTITIWFPEGTTVPQTGWQTGHVTVNSQDVWGGDITVAGTRVTFVVPQHIAPGTVIVVFKQQAGIVNPPAGSYYLYVNTSRAPDSTPMRVGPY